MQGCRPPTSQPSGREHLDAINRLTTASRRAVRVREGQQWVESSSTAALRDQTFGQPNVIARREGQHHLETGHRAGESVGAMMDEMSAHFAEENLRVIGSSDHWAIEPRVRR